MIDVRTNTDEIPEICIETYPESLSAPVKTQKEPDVEAPVGNECPGDDKDSGFEGSLDRYFLPSMERRDSLGLADAFANFQMREDWQNYSY